MSEVYFVKGTRSCDYRNDMENIWAIYNLQRRMGLVRFELTTYGL
jgi:hypothetical protein